MNNLSVQDFIRDLPNTLSKGQKALEALSVYLAARQPVPDAVLREIDNCYRHFMDGKPVTAFRAAIRNEGAPLTLGQAFGVPDIRGGAKTAIKRRRLSMATPDLVRAFTGQNCEKSTTSRDDCNVVAESVGLTTSEVEDWASKYISRPRQKKIQP